MSKTATSTNIAFLSIKQQTNNLQTCGLDKYIESLLHQRETIISHRRPSMKTLNSKESLMLFPHPSSPEHHLHDTSCSCNFHSVSLWPKWKPNTLTGYIELLCNALYKKKYVCFSLSGFGLVCVAYWHLVSVRTFGVMYDHTFSEIANHQIRH